MRPDEGEGGRTDRVGVAAHEVARDYVHLHPSTRAPRAPFSAMCTPARRAALRALLLLCISSSLGFVPLRNVRARRAARAAVSLCAPPALPLPPTFSRTEAEEQVTALISSSPGISRHSKVTVDELQDDLLNYCIAQRTYPDRIVELKLQKEFCAIPCKNPGDQGTFLQACLFAALRTTYPPPVRGAVIPPARTSRAPRLLSLQPQSSFTHGPARR